MIKIIEEVASVDDFLYLREISGLTPRTQEAAIKGLPNSLYGVQLAINNKTIGMARVVGDGALNFEIVDVAVEPRHQGKGYGSLLMQYVMKYIDENATKGAYITLMADVPALYTKFGFKFTSPECEGMFIQK